MDWEVRVLCVYVGVSGSRNGRQVRTLTVSKREERRRGEGKRERERRGREEKREMKVRRREKRRKKKKKRREEKR